MAIPPWSSVMSTGLRPLLGKTASFLDPVTMDNYSMVVSLCASFTLFNPRRLKPLTGDEFLRIGLQKSSIFDTETDPQ